MLIAVIQATDYHSIKQHINAVVNHIDGIEFRLDYWEVIDFETIANLCDEFASLNIIFTLRKKSQGGFYAYTETQRLETIMALCKLEPDYFDLEFDIPYEFLNKIHSHYPDIKLLCSYHNFVETPLDLKEILLRIAHPHFYAYKIATKAQTTLDALRMLQFVKTMCKEYLLTGICMGEYGHCTRILGPIVGNILTYASINNTFTTAPGQLTVEELINIYHWRHLNSSSKIYALLGDPISSSVGHILHNRAIQILNQNAVYLKLRVTADALAQILLIIRELPFAGLSITMPLKEPITLHLDEIDDDARAVKSINSVLIEQAQMIGFNTDGNGCLQVLAEKINLSQQTIVILGAGGAAKAIAYAAMQHGAKVIILNRSLNNLEQLLKELGCDGYSLEKISHLAEMKYTILINTLPISMQANQDMHKLLNKNYLLPNTFAMDIIYQPINTEFLQIAKQAGCICIPGYAMYIQQALLQILRWFQPNQKQINIIKKMMYAYFIRSI